MSGPEFVLMAMTLAAGTYLWVVTTPKVLAYMERRSQRDSGRRARSWQIDKKSGLPIAVDTQLEIERIRSAERERALQTFERLAAEKLDLLKAGITMGYKEQELRELDARLEQIIGSDELKRLLIDVTTPQPPGPALSESAMEHAAEGGLRSTDLASIPTERLQLLLERARQLQAGS